MEYVEENELVRVRELLRHTGEFIAYFELAETKMMEWRAEMEQQSLQLHQNSQRLQTHIASINDLLSQAGTSRFRVIAEKALSQGEKQLHLMENSCNQFTESFQKQHEQLEVLTAQCITKIEQHSNEAMQVIAGQLAKYDAQHFHRIANESCDHVERAANDAVHKSNKLLNRFHIRLGLLAIGSTLATAFVMIMYLSGELPWEMHHKALSERQAGKVLLQAWPSLTQEEKIKILTKDDPHNEG